MPLSGLYAFLNSYRFVGDKSSAIEIDVNSAGGKEVDFVRRLRNIFAHGTGNYDPTNRKHGKLRKELIEYFGEPETSVDFPLTINTVIEGLFNGCASYIRAKY